MKNPQNNSIHYGEPEQRSDGYWQADTSYMKFAWIDFDIPKRPGLWKNYIISGLLDK